MANKIKKGFTTYLLVLFIALVAAFLICVTIMLFSPFKNVLGFQYFIHNSETYEYNVTGGQDEQIFDFSNINEVKINCNYADVSIERYDKVDNHAIKFINNTKGFARGNQDTSFTYELSYEDSAQSILIIEVHEPEGFLYFSKDITISILVPISATYALEDTKIDVTNTSGDVYVGNSHEITNVGSNEINLNSLAVKTNSGKVHIFPLIESTFKDIFIKTNKGEVKVEQDVVVTDQLSIYAKSGKVDFGSIDFQNQSSNATLNLSNAKFSATTIKGNVNLLMESGYFDIERVEGNVVSNDANIQMKSAKITIGEVTGVVSLPFVNGTDISVATMASGSEFFANSTSGDIKIDKTYGKVYVETTSGNVNVHTFADDLQIKTKSGDIDVVYENSAIANQLDFATESGSMNLQVKSTLAFTLVVYDTDEKLRTDDVNVEGFEGKFVNPLIINGGTKKMVIFSNSDVNISLLEVA